MKQSLQLRLGQHLTMTPQLQQAIRLLQLSTLDLRAEIQEALDSNPLLEVSEGGEADADAGIDAGVDIDWEHATHLGEMEATAGVEADHDEGATPTDTGEVSVDLETMGMPDDLPVDSNWEDVYDSLVPTSGSAGSDEGRVFEIASGGESLHGHLVWQMELTPFSDTDRAIAEAIIDSISEEGYLGSSLEDLRLGLGEDIELDEIEAVLHRIQNFDPPGVGARDLRECLLLQLRQFDPATPGLEDARALVQNQLELLGDHDYTRLMRAMKLSREELQRAIAIVQSLNPRPGSAVSSAPAEYIIPDVIVRKLNGSWRVELNHEAIPRLRVNSLYANMIRRADNSSDNTYIKNQLQEARWFIKSLLSRNETLLRVATAIVERQRGFFEFGDEAMKALVLHDIAEELGMHESTISRVTTKKYMHTPRGIFELKYFFSSHVSTATGGSCSSTAIRALIKKLIGAENAAKPLSDSKIAEILVDQGINVARRTVAKYREAMAIPPSSERRRPA